MSPGEELAALRRAAARGGCTVVRSSVQPTSTGPRVIGSVMCPDGWGAARMLLAAAAEDAQTAGARDLALELRAGAPSDEAFARAVFDHVRAGVAFVREPGEVFGSSSYTLALGGGDCDDHARIVYALLRAGGLPARLAFLFKSRRAGPSHVVAQAYAGGAWRWLETTIAARFDEHPIAAARRLGLLGARGDVAAEGVETMTEKDLPPVPAGLLVRSTPEELAQDVEALGALGFMCGGVPSSPIEPRFRAAVYAFQATRPGLDADGLIGPATRRELAAALLASGLGELAGGYMGAIGDAGGTANTADLSPGFFRGVRAMAERLRADGASIDGDDLLAVWNAESGIKASIANGAGAPYYGLNQMGVPQMRAAGFSGSPAEYMALGAEGQLPYVERYYRNATGGRLELLRDSADLYVANFLPAYLPNVARDASFPLAERDNDPHGFYRWNTSLDGDGDGVIVKADLKRAIGAAQRSPRWLEARRRYFEESGATPATGKIAVGLGVLGAMGLLAWWVSRGA
jgi:hypothetical protein